MTASLSEIQNSGSLDTSAPRLSLPAQARTISREDLTLRLEQFPTHTRLVAFEEPVEIRVSKSAR